MRRLLALSAALLAAAPMLGAYTAHAWVSPVPDVVVYATPALARTLAALAARYTAARGVTVHLFVGSNTGQAGLIARRARADVVLADAATIADMQARKLVTPDAPIAIGLDRYVFVSRQSDGIAAGSPQSLDRGHVFVVTDPTAAASFDGQAILRQAVAIPAAPPIGVATTPDVVFTVLHGHGLIGLVHASEAHLSAIVTVGAPPTPPTLIEAAQVSGGQSGHAADFLAFLTGAEARRIIREQGLDPAP